MKERGGGRIESDGSLSWETRRAWEEDGRGGWHAEVRAGKKWDDEQATGGRRKTDGLKLGARDTGRGVRARGECENAREGCEEERAAQGRIEKDGKAEGKMAGKQG